MKDGGFVDISEIGINVMLAIIPSVLLCYYVYTKDVVEKEPIMMLVRLFFLGVLVTVPTYFTERFVLSLVNLEEEGYLNCFIIAFCMVALIEETFKYIIFYFGSWRNKNFDHKYDAIVYAVFVSLGFASLENILYVLNNDTSVAMLRAVISVPAHAFFGVASGFFLGLAKKCSLSNDKKDEIKFKILGFISPVILHGIFDFLLLINNEVLLGVFYSFVALLYFVSFLSIQKVSKGEMLILRKKKKVEAVQPVPVVNPAPVKYDDNILKPANNEHAQKKDEDIISAERPVVNNNQPQVPVQPEPVKINDIPIQNNINIEPKKEEIKQESTIILQAQEVPKQQPINANLENPVNQFGIPKQENNNAGLQNPVNQFGAPKQESVNQNNVQPQPFNPATFLAPSNNNNPINR